MEFRRVLFRSLAFLDPILADYRQGQIDAGYHSVYSSLGQGQNPSGTSDRKLWGLSNDTKLDLGGITLRNIFGYRETKLRSTINTQGAGPIRLVGSLFSPFMRSAEHTSELQSILRITYIVLCMNKKQIIQTH